MLEGRLGIDTARIPHSDRRGLLWLARGNLTVEDGTLRFRTAGGGDLPPGDYGIPFQMVTAIILEPGTTVSHDALRLLARHGTGLVAVGEDGVRFYASLPFGPDDSRLARRQAALWSDAAGGKTTLARRMYAWRFGEVLPDEDLDTLRGIEGARVRELYRRLAEQHGVQWSGRKYDRANPEASDPANQAINHASSAVEAAAQIAVAVTGAIPQLGFIHEDSGNAFCLDVSDLFRESVTLPAAFAGVREWSTRKSDSLERIVRRKAGRVVRAKDIVPAMIDRIKELLDGDDASGDP
ncbi:MAG: type I-E CRISPR-associated endonuclease Cas1e [Anaeromyxobacteraceae bacterium]